MAEHRLTIREHDEHVWQQPGAASDAYRLRLDRLREQGAEILTATHNSVTWRDVNPASPGKVITAVYEDAGAEQPALFPEAVTDV